jgi:hypothetical protein
VQDTSSNICDRYQPTHLIDTEPDRTTALLTLVFALPDLLTLSHCRQQRTASRPLEIGSPPCSGCYMLRTGVDATYKTKDSASKHVLALAHFALSTLYR